MLNCIGTYMLRCTEKLKCIHCSAKCLVRMHIPLELVNELLARWRPWAVFKGLVAQRMAGSTCQIAWLAQWRATGFDARDNDRSIIGALRALPDRRGYLVTGVGLCPPPFHRYNIRSLRCQQIVQCLCVVFCFAESFEAEMNSKLWWHCEGNVDGNWNRGQKILKTCI